MINVSHLFASLLLAAVSAGCSVPKVPDFSELTEELAQASKDIEEGLKGLQRPVFEGTDTVGAIEPASLQGTWQTEVINANVLEQEIEIVTTFNADNTVELFARTQVGERLFEEDSLGTWTVEGDYVLMSEIPSEEATDQTDSEDENVPVDLLDQMNVYELTDNYMVLYHESSQVAYAFTRLQ